MSIGTGIFLSTVLLLFAAATWQITLRNRWWTVTKVTGRILAGLALVGLLAYAWHFVSSLPPTPSITTSLGGAKLGMSPTEAKLTLGKPDAEGEPSMEGLTTRIDFTYSYPALTITFYGKDKYSTRAGIICGQDSQTSLFGFSNSDQEEAVIKRLGPPDTTSISSDGLTKIISYSKWKASFDIAKGVVVGKCIHTFPTMSFTSELLTPEAQRNADLKAEAETNAALQVAAAKAAADEAAQKARDEDALAHLTRSTRSATAPEGDPTDPCAPGLSEKARLQRLASFGTVRETGPRMFEAGPHSVSFLFDGSLLSCN
jgi:hypothetical protein